VELLSPLGTPGSKAKPQGTSDTRRRFRGRDLGGGVTIGPTVRASTISNVSRKSPARVGCALRLCFGAWCAQGGVVPLARRISEQRDFGFLHRDRRHFELLGEKINGINSKPILTDDACQKLTLAEGGVIADGDFTGGRAPAEN